MKQRTITAFFMIITLLPLAVIDHPVAECDAFHLCRPQYGCRPVHAWRYRRRVHGGTSGTGRSDHHL